MTTLRAASLPSADGVVKAARQRIVRSWLDNEEEVLGKLIADRNFVVFRVACDGLEPKKEPPEGAPLLGRPIHPPNSKRR